MRGIIQNKFYDISFFKAKWNADYIINHECIPPLVLPHDIPRAKVFPIPFRDYISLSAGLELKI